MAVPKRKTSKARKARRRTHYKLSAPGLTACSNCGEMRKSHHVCPSCGHYNHFLENVKLVD
jgi:large subunit ribosomal protein L32